MSREHRKCPDKAENTENNERGEIVQEEKEGIPKTSETVKKTF